MMVQFWDGEPLNESGLKYLYIYCANCYGLSKETHEN